AGLHRVLAWPYLFKNYSVRDLAEFLEIYGLPLRLGKYPTGTADEEKATLLRAVAGIGHAAAGIIPDSMVIEFEEAAKGSHEPFASMTDWCERTQSKAILGGTLTSQADGKTSTNALGTVHNEVRHDLLVSDAVQLAGTLTRDLLYPMAVLNGGQVDPRRMPRIVFDTREPEDLKLYADALPPLVALGVQVPVSWVHEKLAIPAAKDNEPVLVAPRPDMALPPELRPKPAASQAALSYRHVALNDQGEVIYPDQAALDATSVPDALNAGLDTLMAPAILAIRDGATPEDAIAALAAAYPDMDDTAISEILARALFVADVWGRVNAQG
ncbi:MAG: phage portal protein family protein, partial [Microvirgula sp.]